MALLLAACAVGWGIGAVILCGIHAAWTIGATGGPNHGEHPFMVNLFPLGLGVLVGMAVMNLRVDVEPQRVRAARVVMIALYLGLLGILFWGR